MNENLVSVSQFSNYVKNIFEAEILLQDICIFGEVSSFNVSNGIAYFTIKDENALLNCVMFKVAEKPNIGDMVIVKGSPNYYVKGGRFSFNVTKIMPYGKGLLYEKFLELKTKLEQKGYFDVSIKKPIPERVKRIGVVTSATGAVIQDIIDVTTRRNNSVDIVLYPVKVQGIGAELEIANGINFFSDYDNVDCVIVARGGGSIEDLQPFNTEIVANATYNCKKPLVSAVGHETDFTIIDFCSDLRAPTPSAAAELVVYEKTKDYDAINLLIDKCESLLKDKFDKISNGIEDCVDVICKDMQSKIKVFKLNLDNLVVKNYTDISNLITQKEYKLNLVNGVISKQNPEMIINKGYVKIKKNNASINSVKNLNLQDVLEIELKDGIINASVTYIREN